MHVVCMHVINIYFKTIILSRIMNIQVRPFEILLYNIGTL